eukprot:g20616.t1
MSLASLLSLGRKEEPAKPPAPEKPKPAATPAPAPSASIVQNEEEPTDPPQAPDLCFRDRSCVPASGKAVTVVVPGCGRCVQRLGCPEGSRQHVCVLAKPAGWTVSVSHSSGSEPVVLRQAQKGPQLQNWIMEKMENPIAMDVSAAHGLLHRLAWIPRIEER